MRIGIVTDIHDDTAKLATVLETLRAENVDAIVSLGDTSDLHGKWEDVTGVAKLLKAHGAVGVWGNHDYGLCRDLQEITQKRFPEETLAYMATMQPRLTLGGCHFTHVEPWLDTEKIEELWCFDGRPEEPERLLKSFAAFTQKIAFIGHFHRWLALTEQGTVDWNGTAPLQLESQSRYLVVVGPLFRGDFAVIDTELWVLDPRTIPANKDSA